ncbi:MAG: DUF1800 family protein [Xanthomonadales bacterium]|nr:DUF1800 family protein [Xanthomonadales bacterium]NNL95940.1 DUF1800 family protein [Xanthomonadales bacterium]
MTHKIRLTVLVSTVLLLVSFGLNAAPPPGKGGGNGNGGGKGGGGKTTTLSAVKKNNWDEAHVRRVLRAFAYGGFATDQQISSWAGMKPNQAVAQILTFDPVNNLLSAPDGEVGNHCGTLQEFQDFISSDDPNNPTAFDQRSRYSLLNSNIDLNTTNTQFAWTRAISTRGCNQFLWKTALYLTNYHASIHVRTPRAGLIRDYFDDYMEALSSGMNFIEVMTVGAKHAAVSRAYGHQYNQWRNDEAFVNEDFAREYFQLFFGILGTTEDADYHENITIKNNALVLTGMNVDKQTGAFGADGSGDWYVSPIVFTDHTDDTGRNIRNELYHYESELGSGSCVEVLHENICGTTADVKLEALGQFAGNHPESLANVPVLFVNFFADDNLDSDKISQIQGSWAEANHDLLSFLQEYAASTAFHNASTYKYFTAFDRNFVLQNAFTLSNEENLSRPSYRSPWDRARDQGMRVFEPIRNVFGHQTGLDAANNPYIFRDGYNQNVFDSDYFYDYQDDYTLSDGGPVQTWTKDWASVIPQSNGQHVVSDVADWLWNHFIGDGGKNFDSIARAQVQALLAEGRDFGYTVDSGNSDQAYSSAEIEGANAAAHAKDQEHAGLVIDLASGTQKDRIGMAINFISMTPYTFAMEGQ